MIRHTLKILQQMLKAVIAGNSLISAGRDIDRILHFVCYHKIPQIYRQHKVWKFYRHILSKITNSKKVGGGGVTPRTRHALVSMLAIFSLHKSMSSSS